MLMDLLDSIGMYCGDLSFRSIQLQGNPIGQGVWIEESMCQMDQVCVGNCHIHAQSNVYPDHPNTWISLSASNFPFLSLGSLFHFHFPSSLILLLSSYAQIIIRLSIPLHLSFPLLHFMLDTPDPLIEQGASSKICHKQNHHVQ